MKYLLLILVFSGAAFGACPGDGVCLQQAANDNAFSATLNITISAASAGQCIHLLTAIDNGQTVTGIVTTNVTWTAVQSTTGSFGSGTAQFKWWKGAVTGTSGTTVAITGSGVPFGLMGSLGVFVTSCTIDATTPVINSGTSSAPTNASFTNTNAADLIFTGFIQNQAATNTSGSPAGYTALTQAGAAASFGIQPAYKVVASSASQTATWALTNPSTWADLMGGDVISSSSGVKRLRGAVIGQ